MPLPLREASDALSQGFFAATFPDDGSARDLHRVGVQAVRNGLFHGRLVRPDRIHMTFLGFAFDQVPLRLVETLARATRSLVMAQFTFELDEFVIANNRMLLKAGCGSATAALLRRALRAALRREGWMLGSGVARDPHVTLGYGFGLPMRRLIQPIGLVVTGITLVQSLHGKGVHVHLRHVPFADPDWPPRAAPDWVSPTRGLPITRASPYHDG